MPLVVLRGLLLAVPEPTTDIHVEALADVGEGECPIFLILADHGAACGRTTASRSVRIPVADVVQ
jgi:hypothetical protein